MIVAYAMSAESLGRTAIIQSVRRLALSGTLTKTKSSEVVMPKDNVVPIAKPDPGLLNFAKEQLALVESGEIVGIVSCAAYRDSYSQCGYNFDKAAHGKALLSELAIVQAEIVQEIGVETGESVMMREFFE